MEKRREICNVVPTEVGLAEDSTLARAILLDHLTTTKMYIPVTNVGKC